MTLYIGDYFWEHNNGVCYPRIAHSSKHIEYFWKGYGTRNFFTKKELLETYPYAVFY